jgi:hypothetical protein
MKLEYPWPEEEDLIVIIEGVGSDARYKIHIFASTRTASTRKVADKVGNW